MKCPFCGSLDTKVIDSRYTEDMNVIRRRRECESCGSRFTTYERVELNVLVIKRDGRREKYEREKIIKGVMKACEKLPISREQIEAIVNAVEMKIREEGKREITSNEIGEMVLEEIKDINPIAYIRFASVYKQFKDINEFKKILGEFRR